MMRLLAKELRQILPIGSLWLAVLVLGYSVQMFTERLDEQTFSSWCEGYCDYDSNTAVAIFSVLLAMVTAFSLFPREHDESTIDFLRALPVSRAALFMAKILAGWFLLCVINILSYLIDALLLSTNPESMGGHFYLQVWWTLLWRDCLFAFIILSHGVLLSWFRTLGLVLYAVYILGLMWAENQWGSSGLWSVFGLLSNEYQGSDLVVNVRGLMVHTAVAIGLLVIACFLWSREESSSTGGRRNTGRAMRVFQVFLIIFSFVGLTAYLVERVGKGTGTAPDADLQVVATEHYRFVYDAARQDVVDYIVQHAEADLVRLGQVLNVSELPHIRVDLSATSEHAAGLAKWKKIQMDLDAFTDDVSQRRVLSHETTHVLQAVESDRAMADNYSAVKFFIEGMAQFTSFDIVPEPERRQSNWQLASIAWKRQNIEFSDLVNAQGFAEKYDEELHYSLGDMWTKAFVDTCGASALGDFLRSVGRKGASKDLPANLFWRDAAQQIGCDLDTINTLWVQQMEAVYEQVDHSAYPVFTDIGIIRDVATGQVKIHAKLQAAKPIVTTEHRDQNQQAEALSHQTSNQLNRGAGFRVPDRFIIRIGSSTTGLSAGVNPVFRGQLITEEDDGSPMVEFVVPESVLSGTRIRYQLGYSPSEYSRYYYESWRRGNTPQSTSQP